MFFTVHWRLVPEHTHTNLRSPEIAAFSSSGHGSRDNGSDSQSLSYVGNIWWCLATVWILVVFDPHLAVFFCHVDPTFAVFFSCLDLGLAILDVAIWIVTWLSFFPSRSQRGCLSAGPALSMMLTGFYDSSKVEWVPNMNRVAHLDRHTQTVLLSCGIYMLLVCSLSLVPDGKGANFFS